MSTCWATPTALVSRFTEEAQVFLQAEAGDEEEEEEEDEEEGSSSEVRPRAAGPVLSFEKCPPRLCDPSFGSRRRPYTEDEGVAGQLRAKDVSNVLRTSPQRREYAWVLSPLRQRLRQLAERLLRWARRRCRPATEA